MISLHETLRAGLIALAVAGGLSAQTVRTVISNGPSSELYDMVFLGDGYTAAEEARFDSDVQQVLNYFQNTATVQPYGAYLDLYNVHTVFRASNESGADKPPLNIFRDTVYDATYWFGGTERCVYIQNTAQASRDAALAPDTDGRVVVLVNDSKYGGCAGQFSVSFNGNSFEDVQAHEWGHSFGLLADEYGGSGTYSGGEPGEPNVTAESTGSKWSHWHGHGGPNGTVGAYEGARYHDRGAWRPEPNCEMRSLFRPFCSVCQEQIVLRFHQECRVIGDALPASPLAARQYESVRFSFTNRIANRAHTIEWRVGTGAFQPGGTTFDWNVGATPVGATGVTVRVTDTSTEVRNDPRNDLVQTHTFVVNVQPAVTGFESGITEVLPARAETIAGSGSTLAPFGGGGPQRVLQAYDGTSLGHDHAVHLSGLALRADESLTGSWPAQTFDVRIDVSTGTTPVTSLSTTFDANHGSDRSMVFDGTLGTAVRTLSSTAPPTATIRIPFREPFHWNPRSGPLVVDIRFRGRTSGAAAAVDAEAGLDIAQILHPSDADAAVATQGPQATAPVLVLVPVVDASPSAVADTFGGFGLSLPWNGPAPARSQTIHAASSFTDSRRTRITRLAWRPQAIGTPSPRRYDLRVSLSTGAAGLHQSPSPTFDQNHGSDRLVVFDGILDVPAQPLSFGAPRPWFVELELQRAFEYVPARGPLVVDVQVRSAVGPRGVPSDASRPGEHPLAVVEATGNAFAANGTVTAGTGLVLAAAGTPSPVLPNATDVAEGVGVVTVPFSGGAGTGSRALDVYGPDALGVSEPIEITHLAWRPDQSVTAIDAATHDLRIDLSTFDGSLTGSSFDQKHGADRTTVFRGLASVPAWRSASGGNSPNDFVLEVHLQQPFRWDPAAGSLIVDVRRYDTIGADAGGIDLAQAAQQPGSGLTRYVHTSDPDAANSNRLPAPGAAVLRLGGGGFGGLATPYGSGCGGPNGIPAISTRGLPWYGNGDFGMRLLDAAGSAPAVWVSGLGRQNLPLDSLGAIGCSLRTTGGLATIGAATDATGQTVLPLPLANDPALQGAVFTSQWAVLDASAPGGLALSSGLESTIR